MSVRNRVVVGVVAWIAVVTFLHLWVNVRLFEGHPGGADRFRIGFLPVT
jgi:hypothetical protein